MKNKKNNYIVVGVAINRNRYIVDVDRRGYDDRMFN